MGVIQIVLSYIFFNSFSLLLFYGRMIFMYYNIIDESVKTQLEIDIGCFIFDEIFNTKEYDIIDCFDIVKQFIPMMSPSREAYFFSSF